jgi:two-component system OmpR family response regulator
MSNILIVDDEAFIPPLLANYLRRMGHSVMEARSALGAMGWLDVEKFDLAVLDVMMMGSITGLDLCRIIRGERRTAAMKLLVISGLPKESEALIAGADAFLLKPFDLLDIGDLVARLLLSHRTVSEAATGFQSVRDAIRLYCQTSPGAQAVQ